MQTAAGGPLFPWQQDTEWVDNWKFRTTPASRSRVLSGKGVETDKQYTERRKKETTKRTWKSDAADVAHGIGEGVLALHPYTAIPYFGAKVGQDIINGNINWNTALNASIPLFHLSPQAVGLREATNIALEDAANAGSKTAKNWRIAREIKQITKNKPNMEVPKPITRTKVGDVEIDNPNLLYHLDRGDGAGAFSNQGAYVENGFLFPGTPKDSSATPYSWWNKGKPYATNVGGQPMTRLMTATENTPGMLHVRSQNYPIGQWNGRKGFVLNSEYVNPEGVNVSENLYTWKPGYGYKKITQEPSTSLAFFERKPTKITEAERLGIPKGDRGNLSLNQKQAIEDLAQYKNSGQYRQIFRVTPDWEDFGWNLNKNNPTFMQQFAADGKVMKGPFARVLLQTPTGKGVVAWNPVKNMGGYSSRSFTIPEGMNWAPGEANMMLDGVNGQKVILTAPKTDFFDAVVEESSKHLGENLSNTIDKNIMKDFWINSRKVQRPGSYMSGDNGTAPLGSTLIEAFKKKQLHKTPLLERPIDQQFIRRTGLSPDSYSSIIRQGNRDGSLRWGEGFTKWNNSAIKNKNIYDAYQQLMEGKISPEQYEGIFNRWSLEIGGRPLQWTTIGEQKIPVHPHPYIYAKKQGGKMNILEFLKNGSGIHIKEKNKGKFTKYCHGKVTDECIRKAKASGNPTLIKRATFAANARKWKHQEGGTFKGYPSKAAYDVRLEEVAGFKKGGKLWLIPRN